MDTEERKFPEPMKKHGRSRLWILCVLFLIFAAGTAGFYYIPALYCRLLMRRAAVSMQAKEYTAAQKTYHEVLETRPSDLSAWLGSLNACEGADDSDGMKAALTDAVAQAEKMTDRERIRQEESLTGILLKAPDIYGEDLQKAYDILKEGQGWFPAGGRIADAVSRLEHQAVRRTKAEARDTEGQTASYAVYEYDSGGQLTKFTWYHRDGSLNYYTVYQYRSDGRKEKEIRHYTDGSTQTAVIEWDAEGRQQKETHYDGSGSVSGYYAYSYDADGRLNRTSRYETDGTLEEYSVFAYDSAGNQIKETDYGADGSVHRYFENSFDAYGNMTAAVWYQADGSIYREFAYEYECWLVRNTGM